MRCSAAVALAITLALAPARAAQQADPTIIEVPLGETVFIQLLSTTPTDQNVGVVRIQDPNRDHSVVKVTLEPGTDGSSHQLKVRNGYDFSLMFAVTGCEARQNVDPTTGRTGRAGSLLFGIRPANEAVMKIPASRTRACLGSFSHVSEIQRPSPLINSNVPDRK